MKLQNLNLVELKAQEMNKIKGGDYWTDLQYKSQKNDFAITKLKAYYSQGGGGSWRNA